jgi:hypothetical protein
MQARLRQVRFRKVLENARDLFDLLDDGRDKKGGDYILDRHYVEVLLDTMIEKAGMIVYDACMLVPDGGARLYERFDRIRSRGRKMLLVEDENGENSLEPEYRLLSRVLDWIDGPQDGPEETLMGFIREVFDHVVLGWKDSPAGFETLTRDSGGASDIIRFLDTDRNLVRRVQDGSGSLLNLVFGDPDGVESPEPGGSPVGPERRWQVVSGGRHLSLCRIDGKTVLRIEACMSSFQDNDILFVYSAGEIVPESLSGFRVEKSKKSTTAWLYGVDAERLEHGLARLKRLIHGGPV